jgi:hypothetical protein
VPLPDIEDVLPGEYLASAHHIEIHAELFALGEDAVDPGEKRVDEKVADELLATPRGNPRDDVFDENRGGVALLEELVQICRTLFVLGIVREFFAEGDHANDVLGR